MFGQTFSFQNGNVHKFYIWGMQGSNDIFVRPYTINTGVENANSFELSHTPIQKGNIINGWNEPRNVFLLVYKTDLGPNSYNLVFIQGYTNYDGLATSGAIDQSYDFEFYVNSIKSVYFDNVNGQTRFRTQSNINLLGGNGNFTNLIPMRPIDIISKLFITASNDDFLDGYGSSLGSRITPMGTHNPNIASVNSRNNNIGNEFFNRINRALKHEEHAQNTSYNQDMSKCWENILNDIEIKEHTLLDSNKFMYDLFQIRSSDALHVFSMRDLIELDSNVLNIVETNPSREDFSPIPQLNTQYFEFTGNTTVHSKIAQEIALAVQSICQSKGMLDKCLLAINSHEHGVLYKPTCVFTDVPDSVCIVSEEVKLKSIDVVVDYIQNVLIPSVSKNGQIKVMAYVDYAFTTNTKVLLSLEDKEPIPFSFPSYCDGIYSPTQANENILNQFAEEVNNEFMSMIDSNPSRPDIFY